MDYNARYYSSTLGRFVSPDTVIPQPGSPLAWDRYSYVNSNPIRYTDSTGHCIDGATTILCIAMAAGAIAGYAVQVGENRSQGMSWGESLTSNISAEKILGGAVIAGSVIVGAAVISAGLAAVGVASSAACMDGDCTDEIRTGIDSIYSVSSDVSTVEQTTTNSSAIQTYYPPNLGFSGKPEVITLQPGTMLDRYGSVYGQFLSPAGTPNWARALPPGVEELPLHTYIINKPIENVLSGMSASWFGQIGGGIQYYLGSPHGQNVQSLLNSGHLLEIK